MSSTTETLIKIDTVLTADSVEWCPLDSVQPILTLGTYQLDEGTRERRGSLGLYTYDYKSISLKQTAQSETEKLSTGILDMKWHDDCLALAGSDGTVHFLRVSETSNCIDAGTVGSVQVNCDDNDHPLCLSLDWSKSPRALVAVSDSKGQISLVQLNGTHSTVSRQWKAHSFEAWIVTFGQEPTQLFSGGDDCSLCVWDHRTPCTNPSLVSKRHTMGVCSLQAHPTKTHLLASGSYDETLLLWDTRSMSKPLKEVQLGGGIWRIKWCRQRPNLLATACMHNGFQLLQCHLETAAEPCVVCGYHEHQSLAYGVDWCPLDISSELTVASCSFYDHSMHIWKASIQ